MRREMVLHRPGGFTLIELLVVLAIIGVLVGLALPAVQSAREASRRTRCQNNLKQLGLALHGYNTAMGSLPMGYMAWTARDPKATAPGWGWSAAILPQLEQTALYQSLNIDLPVDGPANVTARTTALGVYVCPSDLKTGPFTVTAAGGPTVEARTTSYAANHGAGGAIGGDPDRGSGLFLCNRAVRITDIKDGASTTFALGERGSLLVQNAWVGALGDGRGGVQALAGVGNLPPNSPESSPSDFFSPHGGGIHFVMADGSVHLIKPTIARGVYRALATRKGHETIGDF